jgi:spermidine synthase
VNPDDRPRVLDTAHGRGGELILLERHTPAGMHHEIRIDGRFAMSTSDEPTSRLLARASLNRLDQEEGIRVLVGGLGLGLTLREVLDDRRVGKVTVAEIEEAIIGWNATILRAFNQDTLSDPRLRLYCGDVLDFLGENRGGFDVILMDVDNGPSYLLNEKNASLYTHQGLRMMRRCLVPGGILGVWAGRPEPGLERRLHMYYSDVRVDLVADRGDGENIPPTAIYTAARKSRAGKKGR